MHIHFTVECFRIVSNKLNIKRNVSLCLVWFLSSTVSVDVMKTAFNGGKRMHRVCLLGFMDCC